MMMFTEFGRRVEENGSLGTDHGTATPMFILGKGVKGGFYGKHPSLTDLDDGNMKMTTDFRRVYATMIDEWLGYENTAAVLKGPFEPLGVFCLDRASNPLRSVQSRKEGITTPRIGSDYRDDSCCASLLCLFSCPAQFLDILSYGSGRPGGSRTETSAATRRS